MDYKAGMFVYALAFLLGVLFVQQLVSLPASATLFLLSAFVCFCIAILVRQNASAFIKQDHIKQYTLGVSLILLFIFAFVCASYQAERQMASRLGENLVAKNIVVTGRVSNIPLTSGKVQRFEFKVESHRLLNTDIQQRAGKAFPEKIRLSWYYGRPVNAGERWQLEVRLKPPHGFMNPGGFDYEAWLFQHGIQATGYVRKSALNKREQKTSRCIDFFRQTLSQQIDVLAGRSPAGEVHSFSLVKALAVGEKSSITAQQWRVLANTGTSHLMAISGLHIGLASLFAYVLIRRLVPVFVMKYMPAQHVALIAGMITAFCMHWWRGYRFRHSAPLLCYSCYR